MPISKINAEHEIKKKMFKLPDRKDRVLTQGKQFTSILLI